MTTDLIDKIMAYEQGTGLAFRLQGHYGRTAVRLIKAGLVRLSEETK